MASIRLKGNSHTVHGAGAILEVTDSIAAAAANLMLVTLDRAFALVTGGHAEWVDHPKEPEAPGPEIAPEPAPTEVPVTADAADAVEAAGDPAPQVETAEAAPIELALEEPAIAEPAPEAPIEPAGGTEAAPQS